MFDTLSQKKLAGKIAVETLISKGLIVNGMKIGLGTGSTAIEATRVIGALLKTGALKDIRASVTSLQTEIACEELGIPFFSLNSREIGGKLDLSIDGADEIDPANCLIKGGGAALFREKLVAYNSTHFVIIADESKLVTHLGTKFPVPVEVARDARVPVTAALIALGAQPVLREAMRKCGPIITDNGNIILDCLWPAPIDPILMEDKINRICGVIENGLFTVNRPLVFAAKADGAVLER